MKKGLFGALFVLLLFQLADVGCQNPSTASADKDVYVAPSLLKLADWANYKYLDKLKAAKGGNPRTIQMFLDFHGTADGIDGLNHGVACLELIPIVGDENFASACAGCNPKLRALLLERLLLAQGRTEKTELQKPMAEWAPKTWEVLQGKSTAATPDPEKPKDAGELTPSTMKKPGAPATPGTLQGSQATDKPAVPKRGE